MAELSKPAYDIGTLPQFETILRLMLTDPLGKLETGMLLNIVGMYLFSSELTGFIWPVLTDHLELLHS